MRVRWSGASLDDLERIAEFNEQRSSEWAQHVHARIVSRAESLVHAPRQGRPIQASEFRALSIPDVQYVVTYALEPDEIRIMYVHSARELRSPG